ncbi:tyrosine-type recombinase/integrase (plasmid) [Lactiplantibacillus plantarum]|uniref:tyrosine-type recombinase/integrase n=1 Tax=Lactiplantibacillus plantarum TaxID=1590 RepID=UPI00285A96E3|nr:tyrosine-type recombinase/integrase [Lactiplantibacillus plantarum]MDR7678626.1 tyrosine-type recombinase/integrase [Lactiplantibacillus plantarum]
MKQTQKVYPIKDKQVLNKFQDCLLDNKITGMRDYTVWQVGKTTLLRAGDVLSLSKEDVYETNGLPRKSIIIHDHKTGKINTLYLKPVENDLLKYKIWLDTNAPNSKWLFPSVGCSGKTDDDVQHLTVKGYYNILFHVADLLGLDYIGTHSMRKTGAYIVYEQTKNLALVQKMLNHTSPVTTLRYLGLDEESKQEILDGIDFD